MRAGPQGGGFQVTSSLFLQALHLNKLCGVFHNNFKFWMAPKGELNSLHWFESLLDSSDQQIKWKFLDTRICVGKSMVCGEAVSLQVA